MNETVPHEADLDIDSGTKNTWIIIAIFVVTMAGLWAFVIGSKSSSSKKDVETVLTAMQEAAKRTQSGHLTMGLGGQDSALDIYLRVLEENPDYFPAKRAIGNLRERYSAMLSHLISLGEFDRAKRLITHAAFLGEPFASAEFKGQLRELAEEIETLEDKMRLRRQDYVVASYKPLGRFQDQLLDGTKGPVMVFIPEGRFRLGTPATEEGRDNDEGPDVEISVSRFAVSALELTFEEYDKFAVANGLALPADNGWGRGGRPVINVSWRDALAYAQWLSVQTGYRYRLLSEAEWEYMARAGSGDRYHSGNCLAGSQANFNEAKQALAGCPNGGTYAGKTLETGGFEPNAWGVYNVHGNVREWVADCWMAYYHQADAEAVFLTESGDCGSGGKRVLRGGSWEASALSSRAGNRFAADETAAGVSYGIRLAREVVHES